MKSLLKFFSIFNYISLKPDFLHILQPKQWTARDKMQIEDLAVSYQGKIKEIFNNVK